MASNRSRTSLISILSPVMPIKVVLYLPEATAELSKSHEAVYARCGLYRRSESCSVGSGPTCELGAGPGSILSVESNENVEFKAKNVESKIAFLLFKKSGKSLKLLQPYVTF